MYVRAFLPHQINVIVNLIVRICEIQYRPFCQKIEMESITGGFTDMLINPRLTLNLFCRGLVGMDPPIPTHHQES